MTTNRTAAHLIAPSPAGGAESVVVALTAGAPERTRAVILNQVAGEMTPQHELVSRLHSLGASAHEIRCGRRRYRAEIRALDRWLRDTACGLVHTHGYHADWVGLHAARRVGVPVIGTVHGYVARNIKGRFYNLVDRRLLRRFDAVIAVSQGIRDQLIASGVPGKRVHLVQNGIVPITDVLSRAEARQRLGLAPEGPVIGWIGRLSPEKGPDILLTAIADGVGLAHVVLIGDGSERAQLAKQAATLRLNIAERVTFAGHRPDAATLLPAFDVLALTSRMEGTPMVILEAVAAGVPVVAFAIGGVPDLLGNDSAWLVRPGDVRALGDALRIAVADPGEGLRRAARARALLAERLNLERWLGRVWDVYDVAVRATLLG